mgnify:CR=1 FL=1
MAQRGNILFLILLAIILFVALSYAVNSGMRGGGNNASAEQAQSVAAELVQYASLLENTVSRLRLTNGCSDTQISAQNGIETGYTNPNAPADKRCHIFDAAGGGMAWKNPKTEWLDAYFSSSPWGTTWLYGQSIIHRSTAIKGVGTHNSVNDLGIADLTYEVPFITDAVCKAVNKEAGLPYPLTSAAGGVIDTAKWDGRYTGCAMPTPCNLWIDLRSGSTPINASTFCVTGQWGYANPEVGKTFNLFVHVLLPR